MTFLLGKNDIYLAILFTWFKFDHYQCSWFYKDVSFLAIKGVHGGCDALKEALRDSHKMKLKYGR